MSTVYDQEQSPLSLSDQIRSKITAIKYIGLSIGTAACFTMATLETNQPDLSPEQIVLAEKYGSEIFDPVDIALKTAGFACLLSISNIKQASKDQF